MIALGFSVAKLRAYTFAPFKVVWSQVASTLDAAVVASGSPPGVLEDKTFVPDHSLCSISFQNESEANYVCACLNSSISRWIVKNYIAIHPSPNIMNYLPIKRYNPDDPLHCRLSELSHACHRAADSDMESSVAEIERELDKAMAKLWKVSTDSVEDFRRSLLGAEEDAPE
jgi:hypothetical protein